MGLYIQISVSLHGVFRIGRFKEKECRYPEGTNVQNIIDDLGIPDTLLGIILINGVHSRHESVLSNGDQLMLLPLLEGG